MHFQLQITKNSIYLKVANQCKTNNMLLQQQQKKRINRLNQMKPKNFEFFFSDELLKHSCFQNENEIFFAQNNDIKKIKSF